MVMPGDNTNMEVELIQPIAMDQGLPSRSRGRSHGGCPGSSRRSSSKGGARPPYFTRSVRAWRSRRSRIRLKGYDHQQVDTPASPDRGDGAANRRDITGPVPLPTEKNVYCVIRGPFIDKDSREHFEVRTHKRLIDIHSPTPRTVDSLMRLDLPAGVDIEIKL